MLSISFGLLCNEAEAQTKPDRIDVPGLKHPEYCHPGDPTMCAVEHEVGEKAPVPGILQTFKQAADIAVKSDPARLKERVDEAVASAKKEDKADLDLEKKYHQIDNDAWGEKMKASEENFKKQLEIVKMKWYEHPAFIIPVTVSLTIGVIAGTAWIYHELRP